MRILALIVLMLSGVFANVCEDNKKKIEDKILWEFLNETYNQVELCKTLHSMYPQMKANECQVAKSTKTTRNEWCELLVGAYALYGIKASKNDCKYTRTDEYVKDIQNLPNVLRKYVFDVRAVNELATADKCIAVSSVKYQYEINDEVVEKIKTALKRLDDENRLYLRFMEDEDFKEATLRVYRFVGDKLLKDFTRYYDEYAGLTATIVKYDNSWELPIEYEVINWANLRRDSWAKEWVDNIKAIYTSNYTVKCYKKSPNESISLDFKDIRNHFNENNITCAELKKKIEKF